MARAPSSDLEADIAAALDWWREAGVDAGFADSPAAWLGNPAGEEASPAPPPTIDEAVPVALEPQIGGPSAQWPQDLATFRQWWLAEPSLDEGGLAPRLAPIGEAGAELMVLVEMPGKDDRDGLLDGAQGQLLDAFLAAAGVKPARVYRASVLPRHTPLPDWAWLARQGIAELLVHQVALVRPRRVLVLGSNILPLCGHDPAQGSAASTFFNHEGGRVPALFEAGLDRMLERAPIKARLWKRWLEWTGSTSWDDTGG